jgi:hypothetical protein
LRAAQILDSPKARAAGDATAKPRIDPSDDAALPRLSSFFFFIPSCFRPKPNGLGGFATGRVSNRR